MDRITQLQDEIQQLLTIMSSSIAYMTSRANFLQVSPEVPVTKQRNPEKYDAPEVFEESKKEMVGDLMMKAKQVEILISSLPEPEAEEAQTNRLNQLEEDMTRANEDYIRAFNRAKNLHSTISAMLRSMLDENDMFDTPG